MTRRQARKARQIALLVLQWRVARSSGRRELILAALPWRYLNAAWMQQHLVQPTERIRSRNYWY